MYHNEGITILVNKKIYFVFIYKRVEMLPVCVCVCVCVRERERERNRQTDRPRDRNRTAIFVTISF